MIEPVGNQPQKQRANANTLMVLMWALSTKAKITQMHDAEIIIVSIIRRPVYRNA